MRVINHDRDLITIVEFSIESKERLRLELVKGRRVGRILHRDMSDRASVGRAASNYSARLDGVLPFRVLPERRHESLANLQNHGARVRGALGCQS
jgi:hypothetical protein